jgi:signal transduction histidine kinase
MPGLMMGLQGRLIFSFLLLLSVALGGSCWMFYTHSRERFSDTSAETARQLSATLALGAGDELRLRNDEALNDIAQDLIKSRNVLYVAFLNSEGDPVAAGSREPDFYAQRGRFVISDARELLQPRSRVSELFGPYVEVVAPVLGGEHDGGHGRQLDGYVAVGVSLAGEEAMLRRTTYMVVAIGGLLVVISLPMAYLMVHHIFQPIRELVRITKKITSGDLDARVAVSRTDVIGDLARSFNEMVMWVKKQQQDVETANQKLADANRDLEAKVQLRTAQVETAMQRLSAEIAEKEEFLRAVSHDLNAPLRNISGMATMLLAKYKDKFDEDILHRLDRIKKNVDVETDLISELLELSRIKTRRQKMEMVDVEGMVWELRGLFENDLKSRNIQLTVDTMLPVLEAERARIRQIFQNLIDNAIKYMGDSSTREIHIGCTIRLTEAEFYVRDTGMGIEPEDVDKVFLVFRRGKNVAAGAIAGKGVGLASVKSIVETYSGKIWVESKVGEGTTFRFTINGKHVPATALKAAEQGTYSAEPSSAQARVIAARQPVLS